jgi:hypothetical protein
MAAHHNIQATKEHIKEYRLYGSTFYISGYTAAHFTIQAIRQHIIQHRLYGSAL